MGQRDDDAQTADHLRPPKPGALDRAHTVGFTTAKVGAALLGAVDPVTGAVAGGAVEFLSRLLAPPFEKRMREWAELVSSEMQTLIRRRGIDFDQLSANEQFVDAVVHASQVAMRTSQEEKRAALMNAVLNAAVPSPLTEAYQHIFLDLVDSLSVWHLRLLKLFHDPAGWAEAHGHQFPDRSSGSLSDLIKSAYPELYRQQELSDRLWADLHQRGLVIRDGFRSTMTWQAVMSSSTSDLGARFLKFIEEPDTGAE